MRLSTFARSLAACAALAVIAAAVSHAHNASPMPPEQFVRDAKVITVATVKSVIKRKGKCDVNRDVMVEAKSFLKGKLEGAERTLRFTFTDYIWDAKIGCPSVSYGFPPRADVELGTDIIVIVQPWGTPPKDVVTASFNMNKLEDVKRWMKEPAAK